MSERTKADAPGMPSIDDIAVQVFAARIAREGRVGPEEAAGWLPWAYRMAAVVVAGMQSAREVAEAAEEEAAFQRRGDEALRRKDDVARQAWEKESAMRGAGAKRTPLAQGGEEG